MKMARELVCFFACASLIGCASDPPQKKSSQGSSAPPPSVLTIVTSEGTFESTSPAVLFVTPTSQELRVQASNGPDVWTAIGTLEVSDLSTGARTLRVSATPPDPGVANVTRQGASGTVQSSTGDFPFKLGKGKVSGTVTGATPPSLNATFTGSLSVECWVKPGDIPGSNNQQQGGLISDEALVLDEKLASTTCAGLTAWLP